MFYLKEFYRNIFKNPMVGLCFLLFSSLLILSIQFQPEVQNYISKNISVKSDGGHFHALVNSQQNHSRLARQLRTLPGIERVEELSSSKIESQVNELFGNLDIDSMFSDLDLSFAGLKVILNSSIESRSVELIRDYMIRIVGESNLSFGPVIERDQGAVQESSQLLFLSQKGSWLIIGLFLFLWGVFTLMLGTRIQNHAYIIEQFQRRRKVAFKMMNLGSLSVYLLLVFAGYLLGGKEILYLTPFVVVAFLLNLVHLKRFDWNTANS